MDRYFEAFEAGTLTPELCNEKVGDLRPRLEELEGKKRDLEAPRERLKLPAADRDMLEEIVKRFERLMAEGPAPQKKHPVAVLDLEQRTPEEGLEPPTR